MNILININKFIWINFVNKRIYVWTTKTCLTSQSLKRSTNHRQIMKGMPMTNPPIFWDMFRKKKRVKPTKIYQCRVRLKAQKKAKLSKQLIQASLQESQHNALDREKLLWNCESSVLKGWLRRREHHPKMSPKRSCIENFKK